MKSHNEQLAQKVVEAFKQHISAEARAHITEMEYQELSQIVQEALSLEMAEAVEMVDELERRLKQRAERRELEL
ncbi:MAG: hypothetical protein KJ725_19380 [Gammaproteobacteria bacterium]|jgi:hypothetical protein|uniref:hypothetical protein n=1 Tax=Methylotuvimicrobium sp. TaxID=2822413 RepID=UPI001DC3E709|nr:hypothetical protein [Gammaproteobacteria bacterium]